MYPFFRKDLLLSLVHPWNQTGQSVIMLMAVIVVVIVVQRLPSPQPISRRSRNAMVVIIAILIIVTVVGAHCPPSNADSVTIYVIMISLLFHLILV
jgi:hypothetical protein